ncbi:MAG: pyridoxal 5'-phosphate synthase glutaminase subunit PdxT [Chloroflexi bacterium]|nr:pyridoxal 5'-phosphate synthase glutaminase subunit PdxT [Chloroflexota bacterium]
MKIGVLALQGAFIEHVAVLRRLNIEAREIRLPAELAEMDGLIIPGGESTTMLNLMQSYSFVPALQEQIRSGFPVLGTCAGMICLAKRVSSLTNDMKTLAAMDMEVSRNAFGRQVDSFEAELAVPALGEPPFKAVFIRAPLIKEVGPGVDVLTRLPDGTPVAARQGNLLATAFHPELTGDLRFHEYFVKIVAARQS